MNIDETRLAELIAQASKPDEKPMDKVSTQEFAEAAKEMVSKMGPKEASHTIAEMVTIQLTEEAPMDDLTGVFMPNAGMFSMNEGPKFTRTGSPMLYWVGNESQHLKLMESKVTTEQFSMTFDSIYVYFNFNVDLLAAGHFGDFSEQVNKARNQFVGGANMLMWRALSNAIKVGTYANSASGTLSVSTLRDGIDYVEDASETGPKAIWGRRTALSQLGNFTSSTTGSELAPESIKNQAWNQYVLGGFLGVPMVGLRKNKVNLSLTKQINAGFSGLEAIPTTEILITSNDTWGHFAEQGPLQVVDGISVDGRAYQYSAGRRMGAVVWDYGKGCYKFTRS